MWTDYCPNSLDAMELLDRVIFHLTRMRSEALRSNEPESVDDFQNLDTCVWMVRKLREAKSFEL
jgi:hypothetical protein